jgi:tetratricopeptide (TPR) repeat protein
MADDDHEDELEAGTRRAQILMDKLEFSEAESVYRQVLRQCELAATNSSVQCNSTSTVVTDERQRQPEIAVEVERAIVSAVSGLAEIYSRQGRSLTTDECITQWLRLMVHSLALHRDAAELCRQALDRRRRSSLPSSPTADRRLRADDVTFFEDALSLANSRATLIEDALVATFKHQLLQQHKPTTTTHQQMSNSNNEWLQTVLTRCSESSTDYEEIPTDTTGSSSSSSSLSLVGAQDWAPTNVCDVLTSQPVRRRRINFDRIQSAIMQLVSEASNDVRSQYGHLVTAGSVTQSLLQRRVTSELMVRLARSGMQGTDLKDLLQDSITYEEEWQESCRNDLKQNQLSSIKDFSAESRDDVHEEQDDCVDSDSGSDENYETIFIECPSASVESLGHVIVHCSANNKPTVETHSLSPPVNGADDAESSTSSSSAAVQPKVKATSRVSNRVTVLGLNKFGSENFDGIITVWKSYNSVDDDNELQQQQQVIAVDPMRVIHRLPSFEEVSPLTERDRVYRWLETSTQQPTVVDEPLTDNIPVTAGTLSSTKLSQTVGLVSLQVADKLRNDSHYREAFDVYKYALGIFQDHPLVTRNDVDGRKLVAGLLRDIGIVKCYLGDIGAACQLMEESASLYEWNRTEGSQTTTAAAHSDLTRVAEVWYALGNIFLTDDLRENSLLDHMMRLTQSALKEVEQHNENSDDEDNDDDDKVCSRSGSVTSVTDNEDEVSYSVCTHEAIICYQKTLKLLHRCHLDSSSGTITVTPEVAELFASTLSKLADCYVVTGQLDRAVVTYEQTLPYFHLAAVGGSLERRHPLLALNAHILSQLGTVNFLLRNFWRAATIYETAVMLRRQLALDDSASTLTSSTSSSLETAWLHTMYGLTCATLGRDHQCVVWCLRAFTGYVGVLRGRIIDVEPLRRWFVVETLYALGRGYGAIEDGKAKAVHYLTVAKNLACAAADNQIDYPQAIEVLDSLAEACEALSDVEAAQRYQAEASKMAATYYADKPPVTVSSVESLPRRLQVVVTPVDLQNPAETDVIREGVRSMISQLGLKSAEDEWTSPTGSATEYSDPCASIMNAERDLHEAVCKVGGAAVIALTTNGVYLNATSAHQTTTISPSSSAPSVSLGDSVSQQASCRVVKCATPQKTSWLTISTSSSGAEQKLMPTVQQRDNTTAEEHSSATCPDSGIIGQLDATPRCCGRQLNGNDDQKSTYNGSKVDDGKTRTGTVLKVDEANFRPSSSSYSQQLQSVDGVGVRRLRVSSQKPQQQQQPQQLPVEIKTGSTTSINGHHSLRPSNFSSPTASPTVTGPGTSRRRRPIDGRSTTSASSIRSCELLQRQTRLTGQQNDKYQEQKIPTDY